MKIKNILLSIALAAGLCSCRGTMQKTDFSFIQIKTFETIPNLKYIVDIPSCIAFNTLDSTFHLCLQMGFQNTNSHEIYSYALSKDSLKLISEIDFKNPDVSFKYFIASIDSIFLFNNELKYLFLKNRKGDTLVTYKINPELTPLAMYPIGLMGNDKSILVGNTSNTEGMGLKQDRISYYKAIQPILLLTIKDTIISCRPITKYPEKYINSGNNYQDVFPSACFGKDGNICISFGADDFLYMYHDSTFLFKKAVKSNLIDQFNPYPDEKRFDMLALKNYWAEEPKYSRVIFDPYKNLFYRIVKHRESNSQQNKKVEKSWSVIILDTDLNILDEKIISPEFQPYLFVPTPFGILMAKKSTSQSGNTTLTLMQFKKNEK